ncbi:MAG: radical SAM protein [Candidatus Tectomicrobia bacterium]|uniref:Radical SAM protein n=1 Tax=Tectimicrobiota bacterium TaxID=2528274 RepID=A0A932G257_UNCTE|nr:radical SAM protein [Candidatus Tectomicrobia bacterium]
MEIYAIPFNQQFILYRPLRRLAFLGNQAMVRYVRERAAGARPAADGEVDGFLEAIGFWEPDPPPPGPWVPSDEHRPTMAVLLMTSRCNLRCTYCYAHGGEGPLRQMPAGLARMAIDMMVENARALEQERFSLAFHGGGEPTMHWEVLRAAVEHARGKDLPCEITMATNGLWSERQREFILRHFTGLSLSFDGIREVQDAQRPRADGRGSFKAVVETIRALDQAALPYGVRMTATPESFAQLPEGVAFLCQETRCQVIQVEPCYAPGRGGHFDPHPEQAGAFTRAFLQAFEVASRAGRTLFYSGARPWVVASSFCRAPEDSLVVTPEGDVVTCFETHGRRHPLIARFTIGRASRSGVKVDPEALHAFAARQRERRAACSGCFCYWHCGGDCATRCMSSPAENRGRCQVNRDITRELLAWYIAAGEGIWRGEIRGDRGGTADEKREEVEDIFGES